MRHAGVSRSFLASVLIAASLACASAAPRPPADETSQFGDDIITAERIDAQHASNAWDLLRKLVPRYTYVEDKAGRAVSITAHRGRSSIYLNSEAPMVIVDGARLSSLELLQEMPTDAIDRIELQGSRRGTSSQGTNATGGVIYIHTRYGS